MEDPASVCNDARSELSKAQRDLSVLSGLEVADIAPIDASRSMLHIRSVTLIERNDPNRRSRAVLNIHYRDDFIANEIMISKLVNPVILY